MANKYIDLETVLQGMPDLAKATNYYRKCLQNEGFSEQESMVFVQSWHNYVLPKLVDKQLQID